MNLRLPSPHSPTFRVDAAGVAMALTLTCACAAALCWPMVLARGGTESGPDIALALESQARAEEAMLRQSREALESLQERAAQSVTLQPAGQINSRLVAIAEIADRCGVTVTLLTPQKPRPHAKAVVIPIKVGGTGNYLGITRFVGALHDSLRDTAVVSMTLGGQGPDRTQPASYTLDLAWYAAPAGSAGKPSVSNRSAP